MKFPGKLFKGFFMSLSMFSIIPAPAAWDDDSQDMMLPMLPVTGAVIGLLWYGFSALLLWLSLPLMIMSALILLFPLFMSGFLHMDGCMDTCDAIFSRAGLEKKREILKDPHAGAFAVISACVYFLTGFAAVYTALGRGADLLILAFIPVIPRCVAAIGALNIKLIWENGFAASYKRNTKPAHTAAASVFGALCIAAGLWFCGTAALIVLGTALACSAALCAYSAGQLKGISGDLCGFIITGGELSALLALSAV